MLDGGCCRWHEDLYDQVMALSRNQCWPTVVAVGTPHFRNAVYCEFMRVRSCKKETNHVDSGQSRHPGRSQGIRRRGAVRKRVRQTDMPQGETESMLADGCCRWHQRDHQSPPQRIVANQCWLVVVAFGTLKHHGPLGAVDGESMLASGCCRWHERCAKDAYLVENRINVGWRWLPLALQIGSRESRRNPWRTHRPCCQPVRCRPLDGNAAAQYRALRRKLVGLREFSEL